MRLDLPRICFVTTVGQAREEIEPAPIHNGLAAAAHSKFTKNRGLRAQWSRRSRRRPSTMPWAGVVVELMGAICVSGT
jgi:hypothetical protein